MAGDIVNLRRARKDKVRSAKEREAEENRVRFGQPKVDRSVRKAVADLDVRRHEGHRRTRDARHDDDEPGDATT